ncbi:hypothetical protein B0T17DRAFT_519358 [Bombardia bombarda]|uniref:Uncharacterized protein n=1 Tax=Bombardia bombarda TaxID=252184 RepID=A0AA39XMB1_9PEZI|nr:hypothetical protein B0T17DRAFT_519358 [Bombardia bombarda]
MFSQPALILALAAAAATTVSAESPLHHVAQKRALVEARQQTLTASATAGPGLSTVTASATATGSGSWYDNGCGDALLSVYDSLPTAPPGLIEGLPVDANRCAALSVPGTLTSLYSSYSSDVVSWVSVHGSEISSALGHCSGYVVPGGSDDPCFGLSAGGATASATAAGSAATSSMLFSGDGSGPIIGGSSTSALSGLPTLTHSPVSSAPESFTSGDPRATATEPYLIIGSGGVVSTVTPPGFSTSTSTSTNTTAGASSSTTSTTRVSTAMGTRETGLVGVVVAAAGFLGVVAAL